MSTKGIINHKTSLAALAALVLLSACGGSSSGISTAPPPPGPPPPPPPPPAATVNVSGALTYEFPQRNTSCRGINLDNPVLRPIRGATVQLLDAAGTNVVNSQTSGAGGVYSFDVASSTDFILRVRAELQASNWDVEVRNNVDASASPPPLAQRPIYTMDLAFNSGVASVTDLDLIATTGWDGNSYAATRVAAPFAILDAIYSAMQFVLAEDSNAVFPPLDAFWSPDNQAASPTDIDAGDLPTSFYDGNNSLFLLGDAATDPDEFDDHIVVHEWGHYFEDNFSRSDSIGGSHGLGDSLDMRTAFGEGWASALAGMALNDPIYCDTRSATAGGGFSAETTTGGVDGWFNEFTIIRFIYDLWDTDNDAADNDTSSIGFGPIYQVMTGPQATTAAFTSVFTFATYLKLHGTGQNSFIDGLLTDGGINPTAIDIWGSTETNDASALPPGNPDVLDVYTPLTLGAAPVSICVNSQFDNGRDGNKLSQHRYLTLNVPMSQQVTFTVAANPAPSQPSAGFDCTADDNDPENNEHSDPDILVYRDGQLFVIGFGCTPNSEVTTSGGQLAAGDYVVDLNEFRHEDDDSPGNFPEQVCFDVSAN